MRDLTIRCSSLGKLMTEPPAAAKKAGEVLSAGAKTHIRSLVAQEIFGIDFEVSSKQMEKGILCEPDSIALLNRVRGLALTKNTERRTDGFITGECDLFDLPHRRGHDLKTSWSAATFPILPSDAEDREYEWQVRGYMALWDADKWEVNYALVDTPERLIGFEPLAMHIVSHIPEHMRLTTWTITRDAALEASIRERVRAARDYYAQVIAEFDRTHRQFTPNAQEGLVPGTPGLCASSEPKAATGSPSGDEGQGAHADERAPEPASDFGGAAPSPGEDGASVPAKPGPALPPVARAAA